MTDDAPWLVVGLGNPGRGAPADGGRTHASKLPNSNILYILFYSKKKKKHSAS